MAAPDGLGSRIGQAVANTCGARQKGGMNGVYRTAVIEAAAVSEAVTESARAAADAARAAREAGYASVQATAQAARDTLAAAQVVLRRYVRDPTPEEEAEQKERDASFQGLSLVRVGVVGAAGVLIHRQGTSVSLHKQPRLCRRRRTLRRRATACTP
jgi:hypothetical protein